MASMFLFLFISIVTAEQVLNFKTFDYCQLFLSERQSFGTFE